MIDKKTKVWLFFMKLCRRLFGCHQLTERSFFIGRYQFPLCARCTGLLIGYVVGGITSIFYRAPFYWYIPLLIPLILDGTIQMFTKYESNNIKRIITGIIAGFGYINLLVIFIIFIVGLF